MHSLRKRQKEERIMVEKITGKKQAEKKRIRAIAERDVYKSMYMDLLERKMNG
jgi:hypothetical protein